jgi:alkanesulfonate monooxygenase SsuD/methylene tetrahydromethanopterin reductase-like flavin-dependent oxidoreductase (luciferase family)
MQHGIFIAPFGPLADPHRVMQLATAVEETGWDGLFFWDHVLRPESNEILDPWVMMAAVATCTEHIRIGPMVTPIARRRPIKLAREITTLDLLSQGRLTVGLGLGVDSGGELSRFAEETRDRVRGEMLDDGARLLAALLDGETVVEVDGNYTIDGVSLEPRPHQQPRPPLWFAARAGAKKPVRRAALYEGMFPISMTPAQFDAALEEVVSIRGSLDGFDICLKTNPGDSPPPYLDRATWLLQAFPAVADLDQLFDVVMHGPPQ